MFLYLIQHVFINPSEKKFSCLKEFFAKELEDGQGECFMEIGVGGNVHMSYIYVDIHNMLIF